jgi:hypothetical protein
MLDFIRKSFRTIFTIFLYVTVIASVIGCALIGNAYGELIGLDEYWRVVLGVLAGLLIGLVIIIIGGGLVAVLLKMDENLESINNILKKVSGIETNCEVGFDEKIADKIVDKLDNLFLP